MKTRKANPKPAPAPQPARKPAGGSPGPAPPKPSRRRREPADPLLDLCRGLPGATEDVKWGNDLVFSVGGKMFAVFDLPDRDSIGLKVDPVAFASLTRQPGIIPAPYLAHHSWIKLTSRDALPEPALMELLRESHAMTAAKLPKKVQAALGLAPAPKAKTGAKS